MSKITERAIGSMSESTKKLNPHLFGTATVHYKDPITQEASSVTVSKRLRQDTQPLMNKLETAWFACLKNLDLYDGQTLRAQAKRYKLANGAWYKPDMTAVVNGRETAWECKGPKQMKGIAKGMLTIKVAAAQWPEVKFILVWREAGRWMWQEVLP